MNPFLLVNASQMRKMDKTTIEQHNIAGLELMEAAGKGTVDGMLDILPPQLTSYNEVIENFGSESWVLVLCGSGNNGGDGFVVSRYLAREGYSVVVLLMTDPEKLRGDAKTNYEQLPDGVVVYLDNPDAKEDVETLFRSAETVVDAMLGTGLERDVSGRYAEIIKMANSSNAFKVALDIPSGISADTGQVLGCAFKSDVTYTYGLKKIGQTFYPGKEYCGRVVVVDIGIPGEVVDEVGICATELWEAKAREKIGKLDRMSHKGSLGHLLIIGGSEGKGGAAILAAKSAVRSGVGLVTAAVSQSTQAALLTTVTESMSVVCNGDSVKQQLDLLKEAISGKNAVVIGPGWGVSAENKEILNILLEEFTEVPFILDADALTILAETGLEIIKKRSDIGGLTVLTPHPKEAANLLGVETSEVQGDRLEAATKLAELSGAYVVLKGASTVIASANDGIYVCPFGGPAMATGGSGDILAGFLGGRIAAGEDFWQETICSVVFHSISGDLAKELNGERGVCASDMVEEFGKIWLAWESDEDIL